MITFIIYSLIGAIVFGMNTCEGKLQGLNDRQLLFLSIVCGPLGWLLGGIFYGLRYFEGPEE